ncbi:MAG: hypothetical protein U9P14_05980 [Gemmatimonadota bacterium]|nr:hypothetical protein [Gemmatimonadota bacterium]
MKYLQGSQEKCTGRAVIFLSLKEPMAYMGGQVEMSLLAIFCAASEVDLLELVIQVMRLPREHSRLINRFYKLYFQELEKIKRSFPERISNIIDRVLEDEEHTISEPIRESFREMFRAGREEGDQEQQDQSEKSGALPQPEFYSTMIPLPDRGILETYIQEQDGFDFDIIDLERTEHPALGNLILDARARLYVVDYLIQKEREIALPSDKTYKSPYRNYKKITKNELKHSLAELSSELMFLMETGGETDRVFADLKQLAGGSYLLGQVVSLYNISTTEDPNKIKLMELYFRKIFSLIDEDYLLTKEITEEIQQYGV